jgi:hypothetical protein
MYPPVCPCHSGWHRGEPHPAALNAYRLPSNAPTYRVPSTTTGEDIVPLNGDDHTGWQIGWPHPLALNAASLPSELAEATNTSPPSTAGAE